MWKRSFFLLVEEPEGFPETDIGIFLAKVADDLLSLPKTKVIVSIALSLTEERKLNCMRDLGCNLNLFTWE